MHIADYLRDVLVPANVAVAAMQRAGLPIDIDRVRATRAKWEADIKAMEKEIEAKAEAVGTPFTYSDKHNVHFAKMGKFLYRGLGLTAGKLTEKGGESTDAEALAEYASLTVPRPKLSEDVGVCERGEADHPQVRTVLQIRSKAKAIATYLDSFERTRRSDGACHPKYNFALKTSRLSAEDPPVHQLPEHSDEQVINGIKSCIVPRVNPCKDPQDWDPRKHGSCVRWDIKGAEGAIRIMLGDYYGMRDPILWDYIREGKDIHSKTASLVYGVPDGTFKKGTYQRDAVGKQTFFAKIFGASPPAVKYTIWKKARIRVTYEEAEDICDRFDEGYPGLTQQYTQDQIWLGERYDPRTSMSWCEDAYGRRRAIPVPPDAMRLFKGSKWLEVYKDGTEEAKLLKSRLDHAFHVAANTPTQSINATDTLWMLALCHHGEYVDLKVPPMWAADGIPFPEAKGWQLNGGNGPGGKPMQAWHMNTVHDSGQGDSAPGYLEPMVKLIWRRCTSVPLDWRLEADMPYRIDLQVGPDMANMRDYNDVAKEFGLEPLPIR